ncbi:MAG TPA: tRNA pseudouridine(38-40) synthase TruA [Bacilli bacterium]|nr:MAG: tRNA pseudouridine synthase A [Tenericutes bacterium ADurb.BinA124]HNZ50136.1 tRNA pseudouridine(38-40) synthase TruA [Bacilli bacterium]HOH17917.1 tRNA pseudouridine(38-40) synthase TruA [Bacilli bacterium]HPN60650.1 tRNA pseudouridine(38-40) synthase TruA [Bacilli bacterium]HPX84046.1 tRNA pseudouridine(38-40) synthase TruA [Bacilli bacterium]
MRYKCIVAYDGTLFHGFQTQGHLRTVQSEIEQVLLAINKEATMIYPSGRTDAGVHAHGQVFHFDSAIDIPEQNMKNALNTRLPRDIYIKDVVIVDEDFHARFSAIAKEYHYLIDFSERDPLLKNYRYYCPFHHVDIDSFIAAFKLFEGEHDFRSFTKNQQLSDTTRRIFQISAKQENALVTIKIVGNGFMRHMVRILVAMALEVGRNKITFERLKYIMEQKNRFLSPKIVPSSGLYLFAVYYSQEELKQRLKQDN